LGPKKKTKTHHFEVPETQGVPHVHSKLIYVDYQRRASLEIILDISKGQYASTLHPAAWGRNASSIIERVISMEYNTGWWF
jgi:hypothetical protein